MKTILELEQNQKHKISGRKKSNYEKLEKEYQEGGNPAQCQRRKQS